MRLVSRCAGAGVLAFGLLTLSASTTPQQQQANSDTQATTPANANKPCPTNAQAPEQAKNCQPQDGNAFPEDVSRRAAAKSGSSSQPAAPQAQDNSGNPSQSKPSSAASDNPFPEDVSRKAADAANGSGSSAPSGVSSSASRDPDIDRDIDASRKRLPKPSKNVAPGSLSGVAKAKEDIRIGSYYLDSGDWKGAYGRFSEASQLDVTNVDAAFGLAEAARHLGHAEEAAANYRIYLEVNPDGAKAKAARRALNTLSAAK